MSPEEYLSYLQNEIFGNAAFRETKVGSSGDPLTNAYQNLFPDSATGFYSKTQGQAADDSLRQQFEPLIDGFQTIIPTSMVNLRGIPIGSILIGRPNAMVIRVPSGGFVVILEGALMLVLTTINLALTLLDKSTRKGVKPNKGSRLSHESLVKTLRMTVTSMVNRTQVKSELLEMAANSAELMNALILTYGQIRFVLAHELGHIALGHFGDDTTRDYEIPSTGRSRVTVSAFEKSRAEEIDADSVAANLCIFLAADARPLPLQAAFASGPELFFSNLNLMERITRTEFREDSTHPSSLERLSAIRKKVRPELQPKMVILLNRWQGYLDELIAKT